MIQAPKAALFDLDETLAESFKTPTRAMISRIHAVLRHMPFAIVTGRDFDWMKDDFLSQITDSPDAERFYVVAEGGAEGYAWKNGSWHKEYGMNLADAERPAIRHAILEAVAETGVLDGQTLYGEQFVDKHAMIAFAMIGRDVPAELKHTWDPGNTKRHQLAHAVAAKLPQYDVVMGGATTIDVTKKDINKAYGVRWLSEILRMPPEDMLYVGDALYPDGNDEPVIATGVQIIATTGPKETEIILDELIEQTKLDHASPQDSH